MLKTYNHKATYWILLWFYSHCDNIEVYFGAVHVNRLTYHMWLHFPWILRWEYLLRTVAPRCMFYKSKLGKAHIIYKVHANKIGDRWHGLLILTFPLQWLVILDFVSVILPCCSWINLSKPFVLIMWIVFTWYFSELIPNLLPSFRNRLNCGNSYFGQYD